MASLPAPDDLASPLGADSVSSGPVKKTITAVISPQQVAQILAHRVLEEKRIETVPGSMIEAEMLACFAKDELGNVGVAQYRIEFTVDQATEDWKG